MQTVIIIIHLLIVLSLVGVVLLQRSEGGIGMGAGGGGGGGGPGGFMTGRGSASALTRATAILAAAFFATSLTLAILAGQASQPTSVFDAPGGLTAPPAQPGEEAPDGAGPGILEQLQRQQGDEPDSPQVPQSR
ncbi:MAG: preprotein translocase subunit SecG [Saliniramus fredricksonii]|uniref:Protein-export membrane protein SecG n=1 Tax=Saliniramus fredricksonii TaxID=1653334 RepID=A0A0P8A7X3_9HYPH|nr:preprotein translocase subunit SecG [Saliniramus fredricksonii]KPQ11273.1 MAG: preprotein translocase subunit SecG [Saliniramus fredricksonii]SCC81804.1 preprotein translocase subunit SecG [Saliniramus fredricksonii]